MTTEEKAREIIRQEGNCRGFGCEHGEANECPAVDCGLSRNQAAYRLEAARKYLAGIGKLQPQAAPESIVVPPAPLTIAFRDVVIEIDAEREKHLDELVRYDGRCEALICGNCSIRQIFRACKEAPCRKTSAKRYAEALRAIISLAKVKRALHVHVPDDWSWDVDAIPLSGITFDRVEKTPPPVNCRCTNAVIQASPTKGAGVLLEEYMKRGLAEARKQFLGELISASGESSAYSITRTIRDEVRERLTSPEEGETEEE